MNKQGKSYTYAIHERPIALGGGFKVSLYENGFEVGSGIFPLDEENGVDDAWAESDAVNFAENWLCDMRVEAGETPKGGEGVNEKRKTVQIFKLEKAVDADRKKTLREEITQGINAGLLLLDADVIYVGCMEEYAILADAAITIEAETEVTETE